MPTADEIRKKNLTDGKAGEDSGRSFYVRVALPMEHAATIRAEADRQYRTASNLLSMILQDSDEYRELVGTPTLRDEADARAGRAARQEQADRNATLRELDAE
jgi:hypothetical protein